MVYTTLGSGVSVGLPFLSCMSRVSYALTEKLLGTRIVISNTLCDRVLFEEKLCKTCHCCRVVGQFGAPEPLSRFVPSTAPRQDISADLLGPLPTGKSILVVVDCFSRFFKVAVLKSTTSAKIIGAIHPKFAQFGVPCSLWTHNGPQLVSEEFETFLQTQGH